MRELHAIPPHAVNNPSSPSPAQPLSGRYKLIASHCIAYSVPTILGLLMVIFLAIPAMMPPEFGLDSGSSLSSLNISTSHVSAKWNIALSVKNPSKLIAVKYTHMKLLLGFGQLALSRPPLIPTFTQGPGNETTVRAEARSTIAVVNDLGVKGLVSMLKGGKVTIDVVVKAKRRLHLGPWWVAVFDVYARPPGWVGNDWSRWWYFPFVLVKNHAAPAIRACGLAWPEEAYDEDMYGRPHGGDFTGRVGGQLRQGSEGMAKVGLPCGTHHNNVTVACK